MATLMDYSSLEWDGRTDIEEKFSKRFGVSASELQGKLLQYNDNLELTLVDDPNVNIMDGIQPQLMIDMEVQDGYSISSISVNAESTNSKLIVEVTSVSDTDSTSSSTKECSVEINPISNSSAFYSESRIYKDSKNIFIDVNKMFVGYKITVGSNDPYTIEILEIKQFNKNDKKEEEG